MYMHTFVCYIYAPTYWSMILPVSDQLPCTCIRYAFNYTKNVASIGKMETVTKRDGAVAIAKLLYPGLHI